jgi:hypothetical protein
MGVALFNGNDMPAAGQAATGVAPAKPDAAGHADPDTEVSSSTRLTIDLTVGLTGKGTGEVILLRRVASN